jgi:hypothetical protein
MKKYYACLWFFLLSIYSVILISVEVHTSQDFVRNFFTDIQGEVPFYAVNTSLSVFLLLATALMFKIILVALPYTENNFNQTRFYRSQILFFAYLGLDDRFLIHEYLGHIIGINDAVILAMLGLLEIGLILAWGDYQQWSQTTRNYLLGAVICSCMMVLIDGTFPREMIPRLSLEDLSKTWANTLIFLFSWSIFTHNINVLKLKVQSGDNYPRSSFTVK